MFCFPVWVVSWFRLAVFYFFVVLLYFLCLWIVEYAKVRLKSREDD